MKTKDRLNYIAQVFNALEDFLVFNSDKKINRLKSRIQNVVCYNRHETYISLGLELNMKIEVTNKSICVTCNDSADERSLASIVKCYDEAIFFSTAHNFFKRLQKGVSNDTN